ncbi:helix-turn-helix transcriptional regulator [Natrialbaceae archaeon A-arb3/5]
MGIDEQLDVYTTLLKRVSIFEYLLDSPTYQNELVEEINVSQSTVYRGLKQLEDQNLIEKENGFYSPTEFGKVMYVQYERTNKIIRTLSESIRLFETTQNIGAVLDPSVARDATIVETGETRMDLVYEYLEKQVSEATEIRGVVPTISPSLVETYLTRTEAGQLDAKFVLGEEATKLAQTKLEDEFTALRNTGNFNAYSHSSTIPMGVIVITEPNERVLVVVHDDIGVVRGVIDSKNDTAVAWGQNWYSEHIDESTLLTFC